MPFICEYIYKNLTGGESVHLCDYPNLSAIKSDETLMAEMEIPAIVSVDALQVALRDNFLTKFSESYGIDPEPAETAYFVKLVKENPFELDQEQYLSEAIRKECVRRNISEAAMIRQLLTIRNPDEKARIRKEWRTAGLKAVLESESFLHAMEPVNSKFYDWWTKRHPEYEGIAAGIVITDDHEALLDQAAQGRTHRHL